MEHKSGAAGAFLRVHLLVTEEGAECHKKEGLKKVNII